MRKKVLSYSLDRRLAMLGACLGLVACGSNEPVAPAARQPAAARFEVRSPEQDNEALETLRQVTARYHRLDRAIADGFVFLHGCEVRPEGGPVGIVYIHPKRLLDGVIDPSLPDGLIYAPTDSGPRLAAVELAVPFSLWTSPEPPNFLGATFQREDEFGVFGLHVWLWRSNPKGLFAESNPRIFCTEE